MTDNSLLPHEIRASALLRGCFPVPARPSAVPSSVIRDGSTVSMQFNVMPERTVTETLRFKEYRVWPNYVEADFDRSYESEMEKSPSHHIFLSAEAHAQKLAYIALAASFGCPYVPTEKEYFKIWWTSCFCNIPKMIRSENNLQQVLWVTEFVKTGPKAYQFEAYSRVCESMEILGRAGVFLI
jgi:hypothetical protein